MLVHLQVVCVAQGMKLRMRRGMVSRRSAHMHTSHHMCALWQHQHAAQHRQDTGTFLRRLASHLCIKGDIELAAIGVWPRVGHGQHAGPAVPCREALISKALPIDGLAASAGLQPRVTTLQQCSTARKSLACTRARLAWAAQGSMWLIQQPQPVLPCHGSLACCQPEACQAHMQDAHRCAEVQCTSRWMLQSMQQRCACCQSRPCTLRTVMDSWPSSCCCASVGAPVLLVLAPAANAL
jgi:hypothetical protein